MSNPKHTKQQNLQAIPEVKTEIAAAKKECDQVTALAALYQGEKTDASYVFNTAMVMMGVAVAYLLGAIPFVNNLSQGPFAWLSLLLPIPLWLITAFHSLMSLNAMSHGISVRIIEDALFEASELQVRRDFVGSAAGDKIMDITQAKGIHVLTTVVVYCGVVFLVAGFTAYALYSALAIKDHFGLVDAGVVEAIAIATYSLLALMVALSWIEGLRMINRSCAEIPKYVKSSKQVLMLGEAHDGDNRAGDLRHPVR